MNYIRPPFAIGIGQIKKAFLDAKSRGVRLRYLTEITNENISYCKELIKIVDELRHLDGIKGGIAVSETEYMATTVLQEAKPLTQVIYSNVKEVVEQGQYIFDIFGIGQFLPNRKLERLRRSTTC
jgi:two-component system sensor histidine kinase VicK